MPQPVILDWTGTPIDLPKAPDATSQAEIGRIADKWASTAIRDVSPETLARVARNTAPLQDHMSLCDKIYLDAHFQSIAEDYTGSIAGLEWDVLPYVDAPRAKPKAEDVKVAESIGEKLYNAPGITQFIEHLGWGDGLYPLAGAETIWDLNTFLPARFELLDAVRWNWANDNTLRLLTNTNSRDGEPLKPGNWTIHSRVATNPRKSRQHKALSFQYMCARYGVTDVLSLSEKFGKPIPIAYIEDPNDRDAVVEAVMQVGTEFCGVFPKSVKVDLLQAIDLKGNIQLGLAQFGYDQATKLVCGHVLIVDAKSGSGTLAGEGAQKTNIKKTKAGSSRVADSVRQGVMRALTYFHHGEKAARRVPFLVFKVKPAEDDEKKARALVVYNEVLAPLGLAIGGEHVKEVAGVPELVVRPNATTQPSGELIAQIRTTFAELAADLITEEGAMLALKRAGVSEEEAQVAVAATIKNKAKLQKPAQIAPPPDDDEPDDDDQDEEPTEQRGDLRGAAQADEQPKIRTREDVTTVSTLLGQRGAQSRATSILAAARQAADEGKSVREYIDSLFETYDQFDTSKDAELLAQGMIVAEAIGAGDAAARAGGDA